MTTIEKILSIVSIGYFIFLALILVFVPASRQLPILLTLCGIGVVVNAILLYITFKDVFSRQFSSETTRYKWIILILFFMPTILVYLALHGFRPHSTANDP
ncbi:MAG: hypothetical protein D6B25_00405 [Desulfobulbaceae bacterium]|nr:MAG: hypothetical protein D6B25_00405 [Desulfobulbaceae bacterium]